MPLHLIPGRRTILGALATVACLGIVTAMVAPAAEAASAGPVPAGISFLTAPPAPAAVGTSYAVQTRGTGATTPVQLYTQDDSVCTASGSVVTFTAVGTCLVEAHQDADATHAEADAAQLVDIETAAPAAQPVAPRITATTSSATVRTSHGWYRTPVSISFRCSAGSSPVTSCPATVRLTRNLAGQFVTGWVVAADGEAATTTVGPLSIDRTAPTVAVTGVRPGASYHGRGPKARCQATDRVSGVAGCSLVTTTHGHTVTVRATATDRAGNVSRRVVSYRVHAR